MTPLEIMSLATIRISQQSCGGALSSSTTHTIHAISEVTSHLYDAYRTRSTRNIHGVCTLVSTLTRLFVIQPFSSFMHRMFVVQDAYRMVVRVAPLDSTHSLHLSNDMQTSNVPSLCFTQTYNIHHLSQSHNLTLQAPISTYKFSKLIFIHFL